MNSNDHAASMLLGGIPRSDGLALFPLPQVLKENVMDPIAASEYWRWFGVRNCLGPFLDGSPVQSVTAVGALGGPGGHLYQRPTTWGVFRLSSL